MHALRVYRQIFGLIILLELLFMTNSIIHVVYENWEPCFVPLVRDWGIPVTHYRVDLALYLGMAFSLLFVFDRAVCGVVSFRVVTASLLAAYMYLRFVHFYNWNNHYYLNMLLLGLFLVLGDMRGPEDTREYAIFQFLFGIVYFYAGLSKVSTAWLDGDITGTMKLNYNILLPNMVLAWGGFLLDLIGGFVILVQSLRPHAFSTLTNWTLHLSFEAFHAHNLAYMFKSIKFFPLHMLFTPLVFFGNTNEGRRGSAKRNSSWCRLPLAWTIVVGQAVFASRRFFLLVDYPWEIVKANDVAEFHSQVHHFSWRMKSRTATSIVSVKGKWPMLMSIGIEQSLAAPEQRQYVPFSQVFSSKFYGDPECAVQPLINRIRRVVASGSSFVDPSASVHLYWWNEVNHNPYSLIINPEFDFVRGDHLPLLSAPPASQLEPQLFPSDGWEELASVHAHRMYLAGHKQSIPFLVRAIPDVYIPNPLIATPLTDLHPEAIACVYGTAVIRFADGTETLCGGGDKTTYVPLPSDGMFHMQFLQETLFLLGFADA